MDCDPQRKLIHICRVHKTASYDQHLAFCNYVCSYVRLPYGSDTNLTQPLRQLTDKLIRLEPGENIPALPGSVDNEIIFLTNAIQGYLSEIYDQNQRLTEERHRTLIAHYDAMEAQLNPHFLYNTLSVIGMTGLASGNTDVSDMCTELSQLLRYSLSYTGQSVLLSQEIDNARHYLYIMKIRYEDDLKYEWQLDDSLNDITVPKLILQPLIENCFQHGFHQAGTEILSPMKVTDPFSPRQKQMVSFHCQ